MRHDKFICTWSWLDDGWLGYNLKIGNRVFRFAKYLDPTPTYPWYKAWFVDVKPVSYFRYCI